MLKILEKIFKDNNDYFYKVECLRCGNLFFDDGRKSTFMCDRCFNWKETNKVVDDQYPIRVTFKKGKKDVKS